MLCLKIDSDQLAHSYYRIEVPIHPNYNVRHSNHDCDEMKMHRKTQGSHKNRLPSIQISKHTTTTHHRHYQTQTVNF